MRATSWSVASEEESPVAMNPTASRRTLIVSKTVVEHCGAMELRYPEWSVVDTMCLLLIHERGGYGAGWRGGLVVQTHY